VLDGVYQIKPDGELVFIQTPAPTDQVLQLLLRSIITSPMKRLVRQGVLVQEQNQWYVADGVGEDTDTSALRPLQQGSIVLPYCLWSSGRSQGADLARSDALCRYITRPALAKGRVKINGQGQVELKLKTQWRDGTTHHVMSPLEFMQRQRQRQPIAKNHPQKVARCVWVGPNY
jgi:Putative transposase